MCHYWLVSHAVVLQWGLTVGSGRIAGMRAPVPGAYRKRVFIMAVCMCVCVAERQEEKEIKMVEE